MGEGWFGRALSGWVSKYSDLSATGSVDEMQSDIRLSMSKTGRWSGLQPVCLVFPRCHPSFPRCQPVHAPPGRHRLFLGSSQVISAKVHHLPLLAQCASARICCDRPCLLRYGSTYILRFRGLGTPCGVRAPSVKGAVATNLPKSPRARGESARRVDARASGPKAWRRTAS